MNAGGRNMIKKHEASGLAFSLAAGAYIVAALVFSTATLRLDESAKSGAGYVFASFLTSAPVLSAAILITFCITPFGFSDYVGIKFEPKFLLPVALIFAGAFLALGNVNDLFVSFLERFGYKEQATTLPEFSAVNYALCIVVVCVLPAVLEETLFRGVILGGIGGAGIAAAALSAAAFAIYHMSPSKTIYQFAMGFVFALVAQKTKSILPTVIIHALNNFAVVSLAYFAPHIFSDKTLVPYYIAGGAVLLTAGLLILFRFAKGGEGKEKNAEDGLIGGFMKYSAVGFSVCAIIWIARLCS